MLTIWLASRTMATFASGPQKVAAYLGHTMLTLNSQLWDAPTWPDAKLMRSVFGDVESPAPGQVELKPVGLAIKSGAGKRSPALGVVSPPGGLPEVSVAVMVSTAGSPAVSDSGLTFSEYS